MDKKAQREMWHSQTENQRARGLSRRKRCDQKDVNINTLPYWIGRNNKESKEPEKSNTKWATAVIDVPSSSSVESFEKNCTSLGEICLMNSL